MKEQTVYALGFFDGVHLGHQALLKAGRELADKHGCKAGVVTFSSHPDAFIFGKPPALLSTSEDRKALLLACHIETVIERNFDEQLMNTHWSAFLAQLEEIGAAGFVCGDDFRFGKGGEGTAEKLAKWCGAKNIPCIILPQQELDGIRVSSTHIRALLEQGKMAEAVRFLGHPHRMTGCVVHGKHLGHQLGIPTANISLPEGSVRLKNGVYACAARVDGKGYPAVCNIGTQPTFGDNALAVEPWILDFEGDLYGKKLTLDFYDYLRPEQKFSSVEDLKTQIQTDAENTRQLLGCFCRGEHCSPAGGH